MDGGRDGHFRTSGGIELEQGHLCRGILHRYPVGCEIDIILSPFERTGFGTGPKVRKEDLFSKGERAAQRLSRRIHFGWHGGINFSNYIKIEYHEKDLIVKNLAPKWSCDPGCGPAAEERLFCIAKLRKMDFLTASG